MSQNPIKCLIIYDSPEDSKRLEKLLEQVGNTTLLGSLSSTDNLLKFISTKNPDLIFLEIEMKGKTGFELISQFEYKILKSRIILISESDIYALKALNKGIFGYLIKPINIIELKKLIERYIFSRKKY